MTKINEPTFTKDDLIDAMIDLSGDMINVSAMLDYYGGFNESNKEKSNMLNTTANVINCWIDEI